MRVFVVGGSGLVGSNVVSVCDRRGHEMTWTYRESGSEDGEGIQLDKTDRARTRDVIEEWDPDLVVDTAAFHAVDDCESERELAWRVNAEGTANVATATDRVGGHLVYLSTDYVFPGDPADAPYRESDPVAPANYYAETKYAGERAVRIPDTATVLRPSVVYGHGSSNFATWALGELEAGDELGIVDDQASRPTHAPDLARACVEVGERELTGLYHATGPESLSRYRFTRQLARSFGHDEDLVSPITTGELGREAPRPADSSLDSSRLYDALGWEFAAPRAGFEAMDGEDGR